MKKIFNRKTGMNSIYAVMCVLAVVMVLLINIVSTALASRYPLQIDLTKNRLFELDNATQEAVLALKTPVAIQVLATEERFVSTSTYNAQANAILQQFAKQSAAITLAYIDYVKDPTFASQYPDLTMKHGDVLVSAGEKHKLVKTEELFNYTKTQQGALTIASSKAEQTIASAILQVVSSDMPQVSVITGHNEVDIAAFTALLESNNFALDTCQLATQPLSDETDIAVLAAPKNDLSPQELEKLDEFLNNDGKYGKTLLYCGDAEQSVLPNVEAFLAEWGVVVGTGVVFETDANRVYNYQPFHAIADYASDAYASLLRSTQVPMLVPISRPLALAFDHQGNITTETLLQFGASAGVRPVDADENFSAEEAVQTGPLPALVLSAYTLRDGNNANVVDGRSQVLISGSVSMLDSYAVNNTAFSNAEYLTLVLNQLCQRENVVTITPKTMEGAALNITQQTADWLGSLFVFVIPAIVLGFGILVWLMRRHK